MVCGGGALNGGLMARLQSGLPQLKVVSTAERGLPPLQVEAAAFAWLARQTLLRLPGNSPKVTGAQGARILGGVFPA
jgi:anhydro-N-acetylmuramic acid kinase